MEKPIKENDGRTRMHVLVKCDECKRDYFRPKRFTKKIGGFCSKICATQAAKKKRVGVVCAFCAKEFFVPKSKSSSRSGLKFCSRKCKDNAQLGGIGIAGNYINGNSSYRKKALKHYGSRCSVCGYDIEVCLQVHHRDMNRRNNKVVNLDVLCPTHHAEYHKGIRRY